MRGPITWLRNGLETVAAAEAARREDFAACIAQLDQVLATFNALLHISRVESGAQHHGRLTLGDSSPGLVVTIELPAPTLRPLVA